MARTNRRQFTAEQKAALLKRHLIDHVPVSTLCEENGIQPSVFYHWQRQLFEQAAGVFDRPTKAGRSTDRHEQKIAQLEAKLSRKDSVIAQISEEFVQLKKELGEL